MSRRRDRNVKATAASMVIQTLKNKGAVNEATAVGYSAFKNVKMSNATLSYTIANLVDEKVLVMVGDDKFYYSEAGYKALEKRFMRGYSAFIVVPVLMVILFLILQHFVFK